MKKNRGAGVALMPMLRASMLRTYLFEIRTPGHCHMMSFRECRQVRRRLSIVS